MRNSAISRRTFLHESAAFASVFSLSHGKSSAKAVAPSGNSVAEHDTPGFHLNYILGSPMYGKAPLADVLAEAPKIDASQIDIWPLPHANHVEQVRAMGMDRFARLLHEHDIELGVITRYDLGPERIHEVMPQLKQLGGRIVITGAGRGEGDSVKEQVQRFVEGMRPHVDKAEELGIFIGIENHANTLLHSLDSIRYFAEQAGSPHWGLAMAPYHLPQDPVQIAKLIEDLGPKLVFFQAWQYGMGCMGKLPKEDEMLQMPGRGTLDFHPILAALAKIEYQGWTEIFMHPVPRGVPIRASIQEVTAEINHARKYLEKCLNEISPGAHDQDDGSTPA
ncbi:MAG: sugar phosphate isomerase/epimerase [Pirellulales bacterium]|nr:sugar phosphate isomerase/epimerase [Pirellulales bacterium]